jgi:prepilin-type N-terminal cleavage/methylation domain-containing protein
VQSPFNSFRPLADNEVMRRSPSASDLLRGRRSLSGRQSHHSVPTDTTTDGHDARPEDRDHRDRSDHPDHRPRRDRRDRGISLIEVLVAVVLLGLGVTAVLAGLRTTTAAASIDRQHATAFAWLHAASDSIYRADRLSCETHAPGEIAAAYQVAARATSIVPDGWNVSSIEVTGVEFLWRSSFDEPYEWDVAGCLEGPAYADAEQYTQRVTLQVTTPGGTVKTLQMVKGRS